MELLKTLLPLSTEMLAIWLILASPFVGSFLGLVVVRLPLKEPIFTGRSKCRTCGIKLGLVDLIPIVSFVASRGKCRVCGSPLSPVYLICEVGALVIAFWATMIIDPTFWLASCALGWSLLALTLIDIQTLRLPLPLIGMVLGCGALTVGLLLPESYLSHLIGALIGFSSLFLVRIVYARVRQMDGLGQGDEKLFCAGGLWLGMSGIGSALLLAALAALAVVVVRRFMGEPIELGTKIPFGPFLSLGIWLTWVYGPLNF